MTFQTAIDFTGTPDKSGLFYGCCCVVGTAVQVETVKIRLFEIRLSSGMKSGAEFHGHELPERVQLLVLQAAKEAGIRICAQFLDKAETFSLGRNLPPAKDFPGIFLLQTLSWVLKEFPIDRISIDEDVQGKETQRILKSEICRLNRLLRGSTYTKVRFVRSRSDELVQVADVAAYALQKYFRVATESDDMRNFIKAMIKTEYVIAPVAWSDDG